MAVECCVKYVNLLWSKYCGDIEGDEVKLIFLSPTYFKVIQSDIFITCIFHFK